MPVETGVLSHDKEQRMIKRAKELLRLAADGTHVSGAEWVPVVEALLAEIAGLEDQIENYDFRDSDRS